MADIDDILNELGVSDDGAKRPARRLREPEKQRKHSIDRRPASFSPIPSMPSGQRRYGADGQEIIDDPAVPNGPARERPTGVGSAIAGPTTRTPPTRPGASPATCANACSPPAWSTPAR